MAMPLRHYFMDMFSNYLKHLYDIRFNAL